MLVVFKSLVNISTIKLYCDLKKNIWFRSRSNIAHDRSENVPIGVVLMDLRKTFLCKIKRCMMFPVFLYSCVKHRKQGIKIFKTDNLFQFLIRCFTKFNR